MNKQTVPRLRRLGTLTLLFGVALVAGRPLAVRAEGTFDAVNARAVADGLRAQYSIKKFIIVEDFVDAGGPTAQSRLDSNGSQSFAALPDPGGLVLGYNTVVGLVLGQGLPFEYPLYAQATHPGEGQKETADPGGAFKVSAKAATDDAEAVAQMRPSGGDAVVSGAVARSSIKREAKAVTATGETTADAITLGNGAVRVAGISSRSVTTRSAGRSEPEVKTSLEVDLIAVNDMRIRYGDKGFEFLGSPVPVPSDTVKGALAEALKPLGMSIDVVGPEAFAGGAKAAVLEIRQIYALPPGESQMILRFGGATSAVGAEDVLPVSDIVSDVPADAGATGADEVSAASSDASAVSGEASEGSAFSSGSGGFGSAFDTGGAGGASDFPAGGAAAPEAQPTVGLVASAPVIGSHSSVEGPYAALVLAGLGFVLVSAEWARRSAAAALWMDR
jgi:hypothetical protein